ncbi:hypothetical protein GPA10_03620 [Streptomyces sp. p1417]|uniref:Uncharacterized protein n=1 Tax=Streptomyces typhae TaxID=2681492 RepID=A0A6L6WQA9_9ACTN|nr:hypothetical protein [Streptomyces typhae]MVO83877.1 hypothetical protein [Streptomyces typhae]
MSKKDPETERIDRELKAIREESKTADTRLTELEDKTVKLGHELTPVKAEGTGLVSDWKVFALEIVAAKVAWDVLKAELPPFIKLNEEALLERHRLKYKDIGGGLFQRLTRDRPAPTAPTTDPATPPASPSRSTTPNPAQPSRTTTTTPPARRTTALPSTSDTRAAVTNARRVTDEQNRLTRATNDTRRSLDG